MANRTCSIDVDSDDSISVSSDECEETKTSSGNGILETSDSHELLDPAFKGSVVQLQASELQTPESCVRDYQCHVLQESPSEPKIHDGQDDTQECMILQSPLTSEHQDNVIADFPLKQKASIEENMTSDPSDVPFESSAKDHDFINQDVQTSKSSDSSIPIQSPVFTDPASQQALIPENVTSEVDFVEEKHMVLELPSNLQISSGIQETMTSELQLPVGHPNAVVSVSPFQDKVSHIGSASESMSETNLPKEWAAVPDLNLGISPLQSVVPRSDAVSQSLLKANLSNGRTTVPDPNPAVTGTHLQNQMNHVVAASESRSETKLLKFQSAAVLVPYPNPALSGSPQDETCNFDAASESMLKPNLPKDMASVLIPESPSKQLVDFSKLGLKDKETSRQSEREPEAMEVSQVSSGHSDAILSPTDDVRPFGGTPENSTPEDLTKMTPVDRLRWSESSEDSGSPASPRTGSGPRRSRTPRSRQAVLAREDGPMTRSRSRELQRMALGNSGDLMSMESPRNPSAVAVVKPRRRM